MKTYKTNRNLGRLASYLVAVGWPFHFDRTHIEFTASDRFMQCMFSEDPQLAKIEFEIL